MLMERFLNVIHLRRVRQAWQEHMLHNVHGISLIVQETVKYVSSGNLKLTSTTESTWPLKLHKQRSFLTCILYICTFLQCIIMQNIYLQTE